MRCLSPLVLGVLSLHAAATIEEHPTCVIHTISRIHRLQVTQTPL